MSNCGMCDKEFAQGDQWLLLNRFGVGTGKSRCLSEMVNSDDEYIWNPDHEEAEVSQVVLCWPVCASTWIDGQMISADFNASKL